ncbi:MAG: glutamate-ammonia-ligase adenylyltransferase [Kiritimatiellae bacterium]|nr:glutamate-ammonia-ligase adenylyltransferase [Kiritimatiellia bacterium]
MKPSLAQLTAECPAVDERLVAEHLARLEEAYFEAFEPARIGTHLAALSRLTARHPVEVLFRWQADGRADCTVLAFDYPGEFSLITGVLAGLGFSIVSGEVFTYAPTPESDPAPGARRRRGKRADAPFQRRRIIDHFAGSVQIQIASRQVWEGELVACLRGIIGRLESGRRDAVAEAKHQVNEMVAGRLAHLQADALPALYPVEIAVDNASGRCTTLRVVSQDTPAFLYALTTALSLNGVSIERVRIRTTHGRIEDELQVLDARGGKIRDPDLLGRLRLSVLLTKQFTYFLGHSPDPYAALCRFEQLVENVLRLPEQSNWLDLFTSPRALQELARLLGASDFLWEDFVRLQYESLLPILEPQLEGRSLAPSAQATRERLARELAGAQSLDETFRRLNEFKDRAIFAIDLDHILNEGSGPRVLAEHLTRLAELVVETAAGLVYRDLAARHGTPRTVAGLAARYAVFGLGKLGGEALGYASDIELLFVYSDNGRTDGAQPIANSEFFELLVRQTAGSIRAKREGIFHVDLQLRPYGRNGPLACSLENFCRYYGVGGAALSYERLALVRLRAVGGDPELGAQVERLRDEFVYAAKSLDVRELRDIRRKQLKEKTEPGRYNAKFSPGALVDLEYDVQILQVMHGKTRPSLRTPRLHEALNALSEAGVLSGEESGALKEAYQFLRRLINGLRMLRGSARDLFLPPTGAHEFVHLARRMGYRRGGTLEPEQQLRLEFETQTARIRAFVERHFGRDSLPGPAEGNVADLVLSDNVPADLRARILQDAGFADVARAHVNLRALAGTESRRDLFAKLAVLACDTLRREPDPDMALNNWERFARALPDPGAHYQMLLSQPRRLEILLGIFAGSQFLADTLVRYPQFLEWATDPKNLYAQRDRASIKDDVGALSRTFPAQDDWLNALRRFRRRELLRIGTRDIALGVGLADVVRDLSALAEAVTAAALDRVWGAAGATGRPGEYRADQFVILALGKLGGCELNYSSDIDLVGLCDDQRDPGAVGRFSRVMEQVRACLADHTEEGYAYRVDFRLRAYGRAGQLVQSLSALLGYYRNRAALWEVQALLKARPIAGNLALGQRFLEGIKPLLLSPRSPAEVVACVERMRQAGARGRGARRGGSSDVKTGLGGIRDVEFLVQGLQLIHAAREPDILTANTLCGLETLARKGLLDNARAAQLHDDYVFLRRVEHVLQILEDRQIHAVPASETACTALAKRVLGVASDARTFRQQLDRCRDRVREAFAAFANSTK